MTLTELEQAAMLIILETPRRSDYALQSVRRELITMLEMALRNNGHGQRLDAALRLVRGMRREKQAATDAKIAAYITEGGQ